MGSCHTERRMVQEQTDVLSQNRLTFGILDRRGDVVAQQEVLLGELQFIIACCIAVLIILVHDPAGRARLTVSDE